MHSILAQPYESALLAEAYRKDGKPMEGLQLVAEALTVINDTGIRLNEAWVHRLQGELLLQQVNVQGAKETHSQTLDPQAKAEACFLKSIEVARCQGAKLFELQATIGLARLWYSQRQKKQAYKLLSDIYNWFTEGFDMKDLQEAKELLEELTNREIEPSGH